MPRMTANWKTTWVLTAALAAQSSAAWGQAPPEPIVITPQDAGPALAVAADPPSGLKPVVIEVTDDLSPTPIEPQAGVETVQERYPNGAIKIEREVMQDALGNYVHHGDWRMLDPQGVLLAKGQFDQNARTGVWLRWHRRADSPLFSQLPFNQFQEPFVSEGGFQDGQLHGKWIFYDAQQRKVCEWEFAEGQRHGESIWYYAHGHKLRQAPYQRGALHGDWVEWDPQGAEVLRETYHEGRKIAAKTSYHKGGKMKESEGLFLFAKIVPKTADDWWTARPAEFTQIGQDERHGPWTAWYANGQKQLAGEYRNDVEVGRFTWWYANGQKATEGEYKIGKPHGDWTWWHANGQKATQGSYTLGNPVGRWNGWDEAGQLTRAEDHSGSKGEIVEAPSQETNTARHPLRQPRALIVK